MKQDGFFKNRKPRTFYISLERWSSSSPPHWNHNHLGVLLETFFYFHEKGIIWEKLEVYTGSRNGRFTRPLLHAVNSMNIFKMVHLGLSLRDDYERGSEGHSDVCPGITSNTFTQELQLSIEGMISTRRCLAVNNLLQQNTPCLQQLSFRQRNNDWSWTLPGLRDNRTVKRILLQFDENAHVTDEITSEIVAAVARNPNLESLQMLFDKDQSVGDLSATAIERLLSDSTSLRRLCLSAWGSKNSINAECFIQGLKKNRSLQRLDLNFILDYDEVVFTRFFRILPDCPSLEHLNISPDFFFGEDLDQLKLLPRLPRPIILEFEEEHWLEFRGLNLKFVKELLRFHPEVRLRFSLREWDHEKEMYEKEMMDFWHIVGMNWYGRYLLDLPNVPLSIWPLVLEKVNYSSYSWDVDDKKASIIYELLKGPAGAGRISVEERVD